MAGPKLKLIRKGEYLQGEVLMHEVYFSGPGGAELRLASSDGTAFADLKSGSEYQVDFTPTAPTAPATS